MRGAGGVRVVCAATGWIMLDRMVHANTSIHLIARAASGRSRCSRCSRCTAAGLAGVRRFVSAVIRAPNEPRAPGLILAVQVDARLGVCAMERRQTVAGAARRDREAIESAARGRGGVGPGAGDRATIAPNAGRATRFSRFSPGAMYDRTNRYIRARRPYRYLRGRGGRWGRRGVICTRGARGSGWYLPQSCRHPRIRGCGAGLGLPKRPDRAAPACRRERRGATGERAAPG